MFASREGRRLGLGGFLLGACSEMLAAQVRPVPAEFQLYYDC